MNDFERFEAMGEQVNAAVDAAVAKLPERDRVVVEAAVGTSMFAAAIALSPRVEALAHLSAVVLAVNMAAATAGLGVRVELTNKPMPPGRPN